MFSKLIQKGGKLLTQATLKNVAKSASDTAEYMINKTSLLPWDTDKANYNYEDAYMKDYNIAQKRGGRCYRTDNGHIPPLSRNIKSWTEEDARKVIASDEYKKDPQIFNKVKSYYEYKYPD